MFSPVIKYFLYYGLKLLKCFIIWPITIIVSIGPRKKCPPIKNQLLMLSASSIAHKIRTRQVTCVEVISAYIERIKDVNPVLNAVVQDRFENAIEEAHAVDALMATNTKLPDVIASEMPLLGVPLTIKESIGVKGMSNNAARSNIKEHIAVEDADVVRYLKEAGAIVLLVSNTPELCLCWETFNNKIGRTNNPFDVKRSPGGSSGGEAALIGSASSVIGMASDIGGSVRLPAMYTGIFGHKPTPGFVSNKGHVPSATDAHWDNYFTLGPMCRFAEDLPLMLETIIPDPNKRKQLQLHETVDLRKIKLYYAEDEGPNSILTDKMCSEMKTAMRKAIDCLQSKYGIVAKKVHIKGLEDSLPLSTLVMMRMKGIPNIFQKSESNPDTDVVLVLNIHMFQRELRHRQCSNAHCIDDDDDGAQVEIYEWKSVTFEIIKRMTCNSSATLPGILFAPLKAISDRIPEGTYKQMLIKKRAMMDQFQELLGSDGVFLYPAFPDSAHYHYQIFYKLMNASYLAIYNLLEMPVTACPLGLNSKGLPMGIQVVGWQCQDRLTIAVSQALEKEFGGWVPPLEE